MIKRLVIHRFRGIRQGVLDDLGKINLLIGPNNSGKSAILEMLYLAGVAGRECEVLIPEVEPSAWRATTLNRRDFLYQEPMPRLRTRHGEPKVMESPYTVLTDEYTLSIELPLPKEHPLKKFILAAPPEEGGKKPVFGKRDTTRIPLFRLSPDEVSMPEPLIPSYFDELGVTIENTYWVYLWEEPWVYRWQKKEPFDYFAVWAVEGQIPDANHVLLFDFHTSEASFEQGFAKPAYEKVINWEKHIAKRLGNVFPDLHEARVNLKPYKGTKWTGFIEFPDQAPIPIDHFGDGARHAFKVLASLTALREQVSEERPGLFLWEDPELFMHPATLNHLLAEILAVIKNEPIQVFITSQSIELTAFLILVIRKENLEQDFRVFRMGLANGRLSAASFKYENIRAWLEGGMDPRFWIPEDIPLRYKLQSLEMEE